MFDAWGPWAWVAAAWLELVLAYGGYLVYLRARAARLEREAERQPEPDQPEPDQPEPEEAER